MRKFVLLLMAGVVLMTPGARGEFTEDWEAYSHSDEISTQTVWDTAGTTGGQVHRNTGEGGIYDATVVKERDGAATMGAGNWTWGTAFRQIAEPNSPIVATARVYLEPGPYHAIHVGFSPHVETGGNGGAGRAEGPIIDLRLQADSGGVAQWMMRTTDEGAGEADSLPVPAQTDTWYEIRLTTNTDNSVTGEYRQMNIEPGPPTRKLLPSGPWVEVDTMNAMGAWNANYLYISGLRQGYVDDIKVSGRPYWGGDVNKDFHVDIKDVAQQALDWLNCNDPFQPVPCTDVP